LPKRNLLNKVVVFQGRNFTLVQFATYTYAQNVVQCFVAPKKDLNAAAFSLPSAVTA
jgi:hypothetical protein